MKLVDVGVLVAAVWGRHVRHPVAAGWFGKEADDIVPCRVTQMGLLRLLSNPAIMRDDAARDDRSHKLWTDDYLAAFAQVSDATLVTLGHKMSARYPSVRVELLLP